MLEASVWCFFLKVMLTNLVKNNEVTFEWNTVRDNLLVEC